MKKVAPLVLALALMMTTSAAFAASIIYEPFADNVGSLVGDTPGTGLTGTWSATDEYAKTTNLTYGTLSTTGNAIDTSSGSGSGWPPANVQFSTTGTTLASEHLLDDGAELWFSMLFKPSSSLRFGFALADSRLVSNGKTNATGDQGVGFGHALDGKLYAGVWETRDWGGNLAAEPDTYVSGGQALNDDELYLIVGHVEWGADGASNDTVTLYLPGTDLQLGSAVAVSAGVVSQDSFDTLAIINRKTNDVVFDEIRVGATMEDVGITTIPEPASLALGLMGLTMIAAGRRR